MAVWSAECAVDEPLARTLIESQFPELRGAEITLLGVGWDNTAYRVLKGAGQAPFVFRFPRREVAVALLQVECSVLPRIAEWLTLPVPAPIYQGAASHEYPWTFAGYRMLSGRTACSFALSDSERCVLAEPLGRFLRSLHSIDTSTFSHLPGDQFGKLHLAKRLPMIREFLNTHADLPSRKLITELCDRLERTQPVDQSRCLTHGDFYVRHLFLNDDRELAGIIDWGDLAINSPAADLSIVFTFLPESGRSEFFKAYGDVPEAAIDLARMRAITYGCILLDYGTEVNDPALVREARRALLL